MWYVQNQIIIVSLVVVVVLSSLLLSLPLVVNLFVLFLFLVFYQDDANKLGMRGLIKTARCSLVIGMMWVLVLLIFPLWMKGLPN